MITRIETNKHYVTDVELKALTEIFNVSYEYLIEEKEKLPIELKDSVIYYVGPTPEKPGEIIGSAGPTTSYG